MKKILVVIDMQKDFVDGALGTPEAVAIVPDVVKEIKKKYDKVFVTRDTHQSNYLETQEGRNLPVVHCVENTPGWQLDKKVANALKKVEDPVILNKPTFGSDRLAPRIRAYCDPAEIESITLIGLCTDICVVSNAMLLKVAFPETELRCIAKCCAGVTPESHEAALTTMKMCQVKII